MLAVIAVLEADGVMSRIPSEVYEAIKAKDDNPTFVMLNIGYEGESTGMLYKTAMLKEKLQRWYRQIWPLKAIKSLVGVLRDSVGELPVYDKHQTSDQARFRIGTLLSAAGEKIKDKLSAVGIAYISNKNAAERIHKGELNSCSIEAICMFKLTDNSNKYVVDSVTDVMGIALCDSSVNPPGFKEANILAVVAAMAKDDEGDDEDDEPKAARKGTPQVTLEEIKKYIEEHKVGPNVLFSIETLTKLPQVTDLVNNEVAVKSKELADKIKALETELKPYKAAEQNVKTVEVIRKSTLLKDEYTEVVKYLEDTIPTVEAPTQETVDKIITKQLELMKKAGFKIKSAEAKGADTSGNKGDNKGDNKSDNKGGKDADKSDMTKPANNPLIP
jgi:hypothetical protein